MILRDYQQEAVAATFRYFAEGGGNGLLVMPTASGKSVVQAFFLKKALALYPTERFVLVSHVRELLTQNLGKLRAVWPEAPVGLYSAGLKSRESEQQISICGIQSVYDKADLFGDVGVCIVDEAHLIPRRDGSMYGTFLDGLRQVNPALKIVGMSATPYRLDSGALHEGDDAMFDGIIYEAPVDKLVKDGWLCRLTSRLGVERIDPAGLHVRGGEYIEAEVDALVNTPAHVKSAVEETVARCVDRRKWLVFCCNVAHAENVAAELAAHGIPTGCVTGETPSREREELLAAFDAGTLRAMCSVNVLSTGFDQPDIDAVVMLRPTLSTGLYVQQCGRGMRLHESKADCLVLDFAGNILRHGPINDVKIAAEYRGGTPRYKECPFCHAPIPTGCLTCPECGFIYPRRQIGCYVALHDDEPSPLEPMSHDYTDEVVESMGFGMLKTSVRYVEYRVHQSRPFKPLTLQVTYHCARRESFKEWVCFDHEPGSYPRKKAEAWWRARSTAPVPDSVRDAATMSPLLKRPRTLVTGERDGYPVVLSCLELEDPVIDLVATSAQVDLPFSEEGEV